MCQSVIEIRKGRESEDGATNERIAAGRLVRSYGLARAHEPSFGYGMAFPSKWIATPSSNNVLGHGCTAEGGWYKKEHLRL